MNPTDNHPIEDMELGVLASVTELQQQPNDLPKQLSPECMTEVDFYDLDEPKKKLMLEVALGNKGKCVNLTSGRRGEIYIFDQGDNVTPRYVCAKIPKKLANCSSEETANRFVNELKKQLEFYHHEFVHWAFDFTEIAGVPIALFRYWGSDLDKLLKQGEVSQIQKLSIMTYLCAGLRHCYNKGLIVHQDLKPSNIFLRNMREEYNEGSGDSLNLDIYNFAMIADFGMANAAVEVGAFDGARPYMAPEQWAKTNLSSSTDIFAIGVILYELLTDGHHPVGIKLQDYWPEPKNGNTRKWKKPEQWEKWVKHGCKIENCSSQLDSKVLTFIEKMISTDPASRPAIDEVISFLLELIKEECEASYTRVESLINYYDQQSQNGSLEKTWPYLFSVWEPFEVKFGRAIQY
jgi:eukaryotic-like serine/threonine-protein kinase